MKNKNKRTTFLFLTFSLYIDFISSEEDREAPAGWRWWEGGGIWIPLAFWEWFGTLLFACFLSLEDFERRKKGERKRRRRRRKGEWRCSGCIGIGRIVSGRNWSSSSPIYRRFRFASLSSPLVFGFAWFAKLEIAMCLVWWILLGFWCYWVFVDQSGVFDVFKI